MKWNLEYMSTWLVLTHIFLGYHSGMQSYSPCMGFRSFQMVPQSWILALLLLALAFQGTALTTWGTKHQPLPGLPIWIVYPYGRSTHMGGLPADTWPLQGWRNVICLLSFLIAEPRPIDTLSKYGYKRAGFMGSFSALPTLFIAALGSSGLPLLTKHTC